MIVCVKLRRALLDDDLRHQLPDPIAPREKEWCLDLGWKRKPRARMVLVSRHQYMFAARVRPPRTKEHIKLQDKPNSTPARWGSWHGPPPHLYLWPCGLRGLGVSDESLYWLHAATQPIPRVAGALFYWDGTGWGVRRQLPKAKEVSIVRASMKQHHQKKKDSIK